MQFPPLNAPRGRDRRSEAAAAAQASMDAFHLAMWFAAILLVVGAAVSFVGLRATRPARPSTATAAQPTT